MATGFSVFSLTHGREGILPVQGRSDEPCLDATSRLWRHRLGRAQVDTHGARIREEVQPRKLLSEHGSEMPVGTVAVSLSPREKANYPTKFTPRYAEHWVITECYPKGIMHTVRNLVTYEERQVTRSQSKLLGLPVQEEANDPALPRVRI